MFLRCTRRKKDGKIHTYYSVVENRRVKSGTVVQRTVLYLGEINDSQQAAWRKTLEAFDEDQQQMRTLSLFAEERALPSDAVDAIQVKLSELELRRPRAFGNYWLGHQLWHELRLDQFWQEQLGRGREGVSWTKVLELLVVNQLIDPGSEFRLHRQGFEQSAMDELLDTDFAVAGKDRLYRCLDRMMVHKRRLFVFLQERWRSLFSAPFDVLLYDLTSTYVEGEGKLIEKAQYGYSRDGRFDCLQVVIALVVTPQGFPLAYEVMGGNTSDRTTLRDFLKKIEQSYGKAQRIWVMDRGIPTEAVLAEMRAAQPAVFYLVGTSRSKFRQLEKQWLELPWQKVRESVEVKLLAHEGELFVLAKSEGRWAKERAIRRRKLARLLWSLRSMQRSAPSRDQLLIRLGAAKTAAGRAFGLVKIALPAAGQMVTRQTFRFHLEKAKLGEVELRDGHYLLRSNLSHQHPAVLWEYYIQLTQIEATFKCLKSELAIRPLYHQRECRVEAHILVAFLAYCLHVTLRQRLQAHAPGLTSRAVLEKLSTIQMMDVWIPTTDGRHLVMPRYTKPELDQLLLLKKLNLVLPKQPMPRLQALETPVAAVAFPTSL
jgi:hypothetical protein